MKKILLTTVWLALSVIAAAQSKVCFTFDDLPVAESGRLDSAEKVVLFDSLLASIQRNAIPAIGFVNEYKLSEQGREKAYLAELLRRWSEAGLELGNHTYLHIDYNTTDLAQYTADIIRGETMTSAILAERSQQLRYFRHPFLHMGNSREKADSLADFLSGRGYTVAPVSIDNDDYLFSNAYLQAKKAGQTAEMARIGADYIRYLEAKVVYYEKQSVRLFERNVDHILLLHANTINADYLDAIVGIFRRRNYTFIDLEEALKDPAYTTEITRFGNWGISWIDRWALSQGKKGDFFKEEPLTDDYLK